MARQVLNAVTTLNTGTHLDPMTLDLYGLLEMFAYQAYTGSTSFPAYTGTNVKFRVDTSNSRAVMAFGSSALRSWRTSANALQMGQLGVFWEQSNGSTNVGFGLCESAANSFQYATTGDIPTLYSQITGAHVWYRATASGTAGNPVTLVEDGRFDSSGNFVLAGGAIGHQTGVGAGAAVTQLTSKSTGVTLSKATGQITMNAASLAANTAVSFTLTNTLIAATDVPKVAIASGATAGAYWVDVDQVSAGSCRVSVRNLTGGALAEALVLNFILFKGAAS